MKLYVVRSHDYGLDRKVGGGMKNLAATSKADALRRFSSECTRLDLAEVRYRVALFAVITPERVTAELWIEFLETQDFSSLSFERIKSEERLASDP